jgi:hypothetical protein
VRAGSNSEVLKRKKATSSLSENFILIYLI